MVAGLAAGFDGASLFTLKEIYQFADHRFFDAESFLARMRGDGVHTRKPGRMGRRNHGSRRLARTMATRWTETRTRRSSADFRFQLDESLLQVAEAQSHSREFAAKIRVGTR